jgi:uncharacterized protein
MVTNPWFYAAAIPALLISGISKGGFAGGLGILAVPLMSLAAPPAQVAGITLPVLVLMDAVGVWAYRKTFDRANLLLLLPAALLGNLLGSLTFHWFDDRLLSAMVGTIAVVFALDTWLRRGMNAEPQPRSLVKGTFWGTVSGFTSFISHAGAPPLNVYLLPQRLEKTVYTGTTVLFFAFTNLTKLPSYFALGQLSQGNLLTALALSPCAPIGMYLGIWLHGRVNPAWFFRIVYVAVFVSGLKLLWDAAAPMLRG